MQLVTSLFLFCCLSSAKCSLQLEDAVESSQIESHHKVSRVKKSSFRLVASNKLEFPPKELCIWPEDCRGDRILNQLKLVRTANRVLRIVPPREQLFANYNQTSFLNEDCQVDKCEIVDDMNVADAIIFQNGQVYARPAKRSESQVWIAYLLESPPNTFDLKFKRSNRENNSASFNWTATYRSDSDIVAPYSKFLPFAHKLKEFEQLRSSTCKSRIVIDSDYEQASLEERKLIEGKEARVGWFASNCYAKNNRLEYALELSKHIQVDIFGRCGSKTCDKSNQTSCLQMLNKKYRFYLSFENSNSREYITEKLYRNAFDYNNLGHMILPIVLGPSKEDYSKLVPPASFIHVTDFKSPKELAAYLKLLSSDNPLYYSYFNWRTVGQFIDTKFMCRVCAMLHETLIKRRRKSYRDLVSWWHN